jgi:hypothetical protein
MADAQGAAHRGAAIRRALVPYHECWTGKGGKGRYPYAIGHPLQDVARRLVKGFPSAEAESYAAFLLLAFCTEYEFHAGSGLRHAVYEAAHRLDETGYWRSNARRVMSGNSLFFLEADAGWEEAVDAAAKAWTEAAQRYAVVRIPDFMDFKSDEWRAYHDARKREAAEAAEERDRREYARLRAKYEGC